MNSTCKETRLARNIKSFELTFDMSLHLMFMNYEILAVHFMPFWNLMQSANWPVNSKKKCFSVESIFSVHMIWLKCRLHHSKSITKTVFIYLVRGEKLPKNLSWCFCISVNAFMSPDAFTTLPYSLFWSHDRGRCGHLYEASGKLSSSLAVARNVGYRPLEVPLLSS